MMVECVIDESDPFYERLKQKLTISNVESHQETLQQQHQVNWKGSSSSSSLLWNGFDNNNSHFRTTEIN